MVKGVDDDKATYQIWSFGFDDEEIRYPTHGVSFAKHEERQFGGKRLFDDDHEDYDWEGMENDKGEESEEEDEKLTGTCFMTTSPMSPMIAKVRDLLVSLHVYLNSYHLILFDFDDTCSYLKDMINSMSNEVEKYKTLLYEARNKSEEKNSRIEGLELKIMNLMIDSDSIYMENCIPIVNCMLVKKRNIYCNTAKHLYRKLTKLYHSSDICKEKHRKLLSFINFKREFVYRSSYYNS